MIAQQPVAPGAIPSVQLSVILEETLGDADLFLPLLKLKPTADKYNFKERIRDLESIVQPLKDGLAEQRKRSKDLAAALAEEELRVNADLKACSDETALHREAYQKVHTDLVELQKQQVEREAQICDLREGLDAMHRDREPMQVRLMGTARRADEAEATVRERDDRIEKLEKKLQDAREQQEAQAELVAGVTRSIDSCKENAQIQLDEAAKMLQAQADAAEADRQQLLATAREKEGQLLAAAQEKEEELLAAAQEKEGQLLAAAKEQQAELDRVQAELAGTSSKLENTVEELSAATTSLEAERVLSGELQKQLQTSTLQGSDLANELASTKEQLTDELATSNSELASARRRVAELEDTFQAAQQEHWRTIAEAADKLQQTEQEWSRVATLAAAREQELCRELAVNIQGWAACGEQVKELQAALKRTEEERERFRADTEADQQRAAEERTRTEADFAARLQKAEEERKRLSADASTREKALEVELTQERAQLQSRHAELMDAQATLKTRAEQIEELSRERGSLDTNLQSRKTEVLRLQEELSALKTQLATKGEELATTGVSLRAEAEQVKELSARLKASTQESADLKHDLALSRDQVSELQSSLRRAEQDRERLSSSASTREQALEGELTQLRSRLQAAQDELCSAQSQMRSRGEQVDRLSHERHLLEVESQSSKASVNRLEEELSGITAKLASTREELAVANSSVRSGSEQINELRTRVSVSANEATDLRHELSTSKQQVAELQSSIRIAHEEHERAAAAAASRQQALETDLAQARTRSHTLQEELTTEQASLRATQQELKEVSHERHELEVEFRSYKDHHGTSNQQQMEAIADLKLTVDRLNSKFEAANKDVEDRQHSILEHKTYIQKLENKLRDADGERRELHNAIQELKGNIRVFCRIRPGPQQSAQALKSPDFDKLALSLDGNVHNFSFDKVFVPGTEQDAVFDEVAGLVQSALDGYKVSIFAYGQTGSGKTFTMQGTNDQTQWGLIPRSLRMIFQQSEVMRAKGWKWTLTASFMEVYNEAIRDLLPDTETVSSPVTHSIKHDETWGTIVTNLASYEVSSMEHIVGLMAKANRQRAVGQTDMNATSSRSHAVFALYLRGVNAELNQELNGALHLVDLAGSERLDKSGATGDRLKETQNINKSLSTLTNVFLAKSEGRSHVPFRDSKLTYLMEPCLSGNGKTLMMVNVGPEQENAHETLCSLKFAGQVSKCNTGGKPKRTCVKADGADEKKPSMASTLRANRPPTPLTGRTTRGASTR